MNTDSFQRFINFLIKKHAATGANPGTGTDSKNQQLAEELH